MFQIFCKGSVFAGCCIVAFTATALIYPSDCKSTYFRLEVELIVPALSYFRPPHGLQPPQSKQKQVQLRPGSTLERRFALGAAAMLNIAQRASSPGWFDQAEEIIKPDHGHAQLSPNSLWARGRRERASIRSTPLVNPSPLASCQAQQVFLVNHSAALHSDSLVNKWVFLSSTAAAFRSHLPISYSVSAQGNEKVLCLSTWASSCVSSDTVYCLRTAWQRRHPKRSSSPEAASRSQAQQSEAEGL